MSQIDKTNSIRNFRIKSQYIFSLAIEKVKEIRNKEKSEDIKKYYSYVRALPSLIINNGLIGTLLFYKSKRETVYNSIIYILTEIFKPYKDFSQNNKYNKSQSENDNDLLLDYISGLDSNMLRLLTNEVLLISLYLKRVVEALLKEDIKE